ncbi:MAG: MotA/TolQ/ExbB proton channel family protein [Chitinispirillaceae bacterium]|nr:MotA/TolQ/ExbB proton channel family protein [Chitinispirillaceae bacterium]
MDLLGLFLGFQSDGGVLMWIIFAVGIVAVYTAVDKALFLNRMGRYRRRFLKNAEMVFQKQLVEKPVGFQEYDTLLKQLTKGNSSVCRNNFREFLICTVPHLDRHFTSMNALVSIAPLLGLLGTVMGMVETFRVIMSFGVGNPALTAEGISVALLTTQAGLTVAFPIMIFVNHLSNKKTALLNLIIKDFEEITGKLSPLKSVE